MKNLNPLKNTEPIKERNYPVRKMNVKEGKRVNIDQYPNFHKSGSIKGMKEQYYGKSALLVKSGDWIYKVPKKIYDIAY